MILKCEIKSYINKITERQRTWLADKLEEIGRKIYLVDTDIYLAPDVIISKLNIKESKLLKSIDYLVRIAPTSFFLVYYKEDYFSKINRNNQVIIREYVEQKLFNRQIKQLERNLNLSDVDPKIAIKTWSDITRMIYVSNPDGVQLYINKIKKHNPENARIMQEEYDKLRGI